jgi:hypothetical protein
MWSLDVLSDVLSDGRRFGILGVTDHGTCLVVLVSSLLMAHMLAERAAKGFAKDGLVPAPSFFFMTISTLLGR